MGVIGHASVGGSLSQSNFESTSNHVDGAGNPIGFAPIFIAASNATAAEKSWARLTGGSVCAGTDDGVTINALIASGRHIILSSGTFNISNPIQVWGDNVLIEGQGIGVTIIKSIASALLLYDGYLSLIFVYKNATPYSNITLKGFTIDANRDNMPREPAAATYTADAGTNTTTVVDSQLTSVANDYYNGWSVYNTTRGLWGYVTDYDGGSKTITCQTIAGQTSGDTYYVMRLQSYNLVVNNCTNVKLRDIYFTDTCKTSLYVTGTLAQMTLHATGLKFDSSIALPVQGSYVYCSATDATCYWDNCDFYNSGTNNGGAQPFYLNNGEHYIDNCYFYHCDTCIDVRGASQSGTAHAYVKHCRIDGGQHGWYSIILYDDDNTLDDIYITGQITGSGGHTAIIKVLGDRNHLSHIRTAGVAGQGMTMVQFTSGDNNILRDSNITNDDEASNDGVLVDFAGTSTGNYVINCHLETSYWGIKYNATGTNFVVGGEFVRTSCSKPIGNQTNTEIYVANNLKFGVTSQFTVASSDATAAEKAKADIVCTGTADNLFIQAGITAMAVNGGILQLVGKVFNITTTLVPASNVEIRGEVTYHDDEQARTQLVGGAAVAIIVDVPNDDHHYTFRNVSFVMPANTIGIKCEKGNFPSVRLYECAFIGTSLTASYGAWLKTTYNSEVVNCRFQTLTNGIYLHSINNFYMHGGRATSNTIGINIPSNGDANVFEMIDMSSNGTGMYIEGGSTTQIRNCWFENQTVGLGQEVGLWVYGSFRNSLIDHCVFGSNPTDLYGANSGAGAFHYDNTIRNCWFQGTEGVSVNTDMWGRLTLENNDYDGSIAWGANSTMTSTYAFHGQLSSGATDSIAFSWKNEGTKCIIKSITIELTNPAGAAATLKVGLADDATGTNIGTEFFSAIPVNGSTGVFYSYTTGDTGTQTKPIIIQKAGNATDAFIVVQTKAQSSSGMYGNVTVEYMGGA